MTNLQELLDSIPTAALAQRIGADEATTGQAVQAALPALLGGLARNAEDSGGAASLLSALTQHENDLTAGPIPLEQVDSADGEKIVGHIFGDQSDQVVQTLGGAGGVDSGLVRKLLPILAPIVLSWLSKQVGGQLGGSLGSILGQGKAAGGSTRGGGLDMGSVLQDVLGSALGRSSGTTHADGGGILGKVLGGLFNRR